MKTQAILASGGLGRRLKNRTPKPFILLKGKPLFVHALEVLEESAQIQGIIIVGPRNYLRRFGKIVRRYHLKKVDHIIAGGKTRRDSVELGIKRLDKDTELVLIHDAARPLLTRNMVKQALDAGRKSDGVVVAVPVKSTIKRVQPKTKLVRETLDRRPLWEVQTPQVFPRKIIEMAYQRIKDKATDDAALVEKLGRKVKVVMGSYDNIKITTPEDLIAAKEFLKSRIKT